MGGGGAVVHFLAREGCDVVCAARTTIDVERTAQEVRNLGGRSLAVKTDVTVAGDIERLFAKVKEKFKKVDILVNNAGTLIVKPLADTKEEEWNTILDTNLRGPYLCAREALKLMIPQKSGIIINMSSGSGKYGFPDMSAYCASKFGLNGLTESLAREVEQHGIKVFALCPGGVDTKMYRSAWPNETYADLLRPEDVAGHVLMLCDPKCTVATGSCVDVTKLSWAISFVDKHWKE